MKLAKRFSIILFVVGILLAMSISASAWSVEGYGLGKEDATEVEIINMGGAWVYGQGYNPTFNVIIPDDAQSVELKVNGIVRTGPETWVNGDTNNYIIKFGFADDCFAGENEVTITATYPFGTKSATGKFHAFAKNPVGYTKIAAYEFTKARDVSFMSDESTKPTPTYEAIEGSLNSTADDVYMVFKGPQPAGARVVRTFEGASVGSAEKILNFRYYTSSDDATAAVRLSGIANQTISLPAEAGKWFSVGIHQPHYKYLIGEGTYERRAYIYVNGEYVGRITHSGFGISSSLVVEFNPGSDADDIFAFDHLHMFRVSGTAETSHSSFPMGTDAYDPDEGFEFANFEADEAKVFPVGTRGIAVQISKMKGSYVTDGIPEGVMSLYKDGVLLDAADFSFSAVKDTSTTTNDGNYYLLLESAEAFEPGYYTIASDPDALFGGDATKVAVGGTFTIGTPAVTEYAVADNGTAISGSNVAIKANISAPAAAAATARVFFAVYNEDGALVAAKVAAVTAGSTVPYESSVAVGDATGLTVKAFVFDTANLKPLTTTATTVFAQ